MRLLLLVLFAAGALAGLVYWGQHAPGYALLAWKDWSVQMPLGLFAAFLILAFALLYVLLRLLRRAWRAPAAFSRRMQRRRAERARRHLIDGLLEYVEGRWGQAEKRVLQDAENSETPLLNYLAAAVAAHRQGAYERRDDYLQKALASDARAALAVELLQAQMQLEQGQAEAALATLRRLREQAPDHPHVLRLLARAYLQSKDWDALERLLPAVRRLARDDPEQAAGMETRIVRGLIEQARERRDAEALRKVWESLPRAGRQRPEWLGAYAEALAALGRAEEAERLLARHLKSHWDETLAGLYGSVIGPAPARQLATAEGWLQQHPHSPDLLLSLARLSRANKLWGKARSYYEASLGERPDAAAYLELGELLRQLGETDAAAECYRKGLELASQAQPATQAAAPVLQAARA